MAGGIAQGKYQGSVLLYPVIVIIAADLIARERDALKLVSLDRRRAGRLSASDGRRRTPSVTP
jgi:hypothetical protein